jgi:sec-independent protein translocase protein TatB
LFDIGAPEIFVLLIAAVFLFGPEKLPDFARQAGRMLRTVRQLAANARGDLDRELGPGFAALKAEDLDPRRLVQRHILDVLDEDDDVVTVRPGQRPLSAGEQPPYDADAT